MAFCIVSSLCDSLQRWVWGKKIEHKSSFWKNHQEGVIRSMSFLSETVPETSTGTIDGVSQGQVKGVDTSFSSGAS